MSSNADVIFPCRFCMQGASGSRALVNGCSCTKLRTHPDCLLGNVRKTGNLICDFCHNPFRLDGSNIEQPSRGFDLDAEPLPSQEEIYFAWSSLCDRLIVLILLWIFIKETDVENHLLVNYLVGYTVLYLVLKYFNIGGSLRVCEIYKHMKSTTMQRA